MTSCVVSKKAKLFAGGSVQSNDFHKVVPYISAGSLMILEVEVNGVKAKFLYDTGAPNVISPELASKLNLKAKTTVNVKDSGGKKEQQECVIIDSLSLDGVQFYEMGAVVVNLAANDVLACMDIDGVFGANAMRQAYWELDFDMKNISFSNNISSLTDTAEFSILKFRTKNTGTPIVDMSLNGKEITNVTFDTGSNGHLKLPKGEFYETTQINKPSNFASAKGSTSYGVYGVAKSDTSFYRVIDTVKVANSIDILDLVIEFQGSSKLFGTKLMRNYEMILDWNSNNIYFKSKKENDYNEFSNFGFGLNFDNNKMFVGSLFFNSRAIEKLELGDQIIEINADNVEDIPDEYFCSMMFKNFLHTKYGSNLKLKIKRGEEILLVELNEEVRISLNAE